MTDMGKNLLLWLIIAAVLLTVFNNFNVTPEPESASYSEFIEMVRTDQILSVEIDSLIIHGVKKTGEEFQVIRPYVYDAKLLDDLYNHNVETEGKLPEQRRQHLLPCESKATIDHVAQLLIGLCEKFLSLVPKQSLETR